MSRKESTVQITVIDCCNQCSCWLHYYIGFNVVCKRRIKERKKESSQMSSRTNDNINKTI